MVGHKLSSQFRRNWIRHKMQPPKSRRESIVSEYIDIVQCTIASISYRFVVRCFQSSILTFFIYCSTAWRMVLHIQFSWPHFFFLLFFSLISCSLSVTNCFLFGLCWRQGIFQLTVTFARIHRYHLFKQSSIQVSLFFHRSNLSEKLHVVGPSTVKLLSRRKE